MDDESVSEGAADARPKAIPGRPGLSYQHLEGLRSELLAVFIAVEECHEADLLAARFFVERAMAREQGQDPDAVEPEAPEEGAEAVARAAGKFSLEGWTGPQAPKHDEATDRSEAVADMDRWIEATEVYAAELEGAVSGALPTSSLKSLRSMLKKARTDKLDALR